MMEAAARDRTLRTLLKWVKSGETYRMSNTMAIKLFPAIIDLPNRIVISVPDRLNEFAIYNDIECEWDNQFMEYHFKISEEK